MPGSEEGKKGVGLKRELRLIEAVAIGVGTVVGSGVVKLPGVLAGILGASQVIAWITSGVLCILVALCFAKLSSILPKCGGPYVYCSTAFGRLVGFVIAWAYWIGLTMAIGALAMFVADSLGIILGFSDPYLMTITALVVIAVLTVFNIVGVKVSGIVQDILTVFKVGIWIVFVLFGILAFNPSKVGNVSVPETGALVTAVLIAIWAYLGFEEITMPAEEMKKPERDIPLAIVITILFATGLYVAVSVIAAGIIGTSALASYGSRGVEMAARALWGEVGGTIFSLFMVFSIAAVMNGVLLSNSRLLYAFSRDGLLHPKLTEVHEKYRTPWISILVQSVIAVIVVLSFTTIAEVLSMIDFVLLVPYVFVSLALLVLSIKEKTSAPSNFNLPGEKVVALIAFIFSTILVVKFALDPAHIKAAAYGLAAIALGLPVYFASKKSRK